MKRLLLTAVALLTLGSFGLAEEWLTHYTQALAQAKAQQKAVLIDFTGSDWCGWCMKLDREVFQKEEFKDYASRKLVLLKADFPRRKALPPAEQAQNEKLAAQYQIQGYPTIIVLTPNGAKAGELGYQPGGPRPFINAVERLTGAK
ncbi:MAG: thioredoxin family protein [Verrucomicrobiota bacterium]